MKVSITYLFTIFRYGYPPKLDDDFKALADIERMGFHYLEMEGLGLEHTQRVWDNRHDFKRALGDHGIHVHNFCAVDLSAFYFDIRKDAIYCDAPDALRRRAARTVMAELFSFLTAWLAPITAYLPVGQAKMKRGSNALPHRA